MPHQRSGTGYYGVLLESAMGQAVFFAMEASTLWSLIIPRRTVATLQCRLPSIHVLLPFEQSLGILMLFGYSICDIRI